jgi:hypothetical protein
MNEKVRDRRWFLTRAGQFAAGTIIVDQVPKLAEVLDTQSTVQFVKGQEKFLPSKSGVLVLGGATVKNGGELASAITPSLQELGPVMYADYAETGLEPVSIAKNLINIQKREGIEELSLYCHSEGLQVAGKVVSLLDDKFKYPFIFMDCSPVDLDDVHFSGVYKFLAEIPVYHGGAILTAATDSVVYKNPFAGNAADPDLDWDQLETLYHGQEYIPPLAAVAKRDRSNVIALRPRNPLKDIAVYDVKAENKLRKYFPGMKIFTLGGNQGHGNDPQNAREYNHVIDQAIALSGR